jgi:hypothetical protein
MWKSVAAFIAALTLLPRSLTGIVAFPLALALDEPAGADAALLLPAGVVLLSPVPELADVHPATSAEHATEATATANDLRKPVPSRDLQSAAKLPRLRQDRRSKATLHTARRDTAESKLWVNDHCRRAFGGHQ